MPTAIMEAMASGLPVVASNSGGIAELIQDEENGFLVAEKDVDGLVSQINKTLSNEELFGKIQKKAVEDIKNLDYKELAKKYYKHLCK